MKAISSEFIINETLSVYDEAVRLRRQFHEYPELGNEEFRTSGLIADTLSALGFEISRPAGTAVCALLRGGHPGKTIAFRADMDALPVQEETSLPYSSKVPGKMHACGHDIHMAGLLGAAMILSRHRKSLSGNVKLFFQPDEEGYGGARRMIEGGCLENPHVDAVFGAHISPNLPSGTIGFKRGKFYAAADIFRVIIKGKGCHGAYPNEGVDAVSVASHIVCAAEQIISRRTSPLDSVVITFGTFHGGTARNVVAGEAVLDGVIRALGVDALDRTKELFVRTVSGVAASMGAEAVVEMEHRYPGIVNDILMTDFAMDAVTDVIDSDAVHIINNPTMVTEDFGHFLDRVPGSFYEIGVKPENDTCHPLHNCRLAPDEGSIKNLIAAHTAVAFALLT